MQQLNQVLQAIAKQWSLVRVQSIPIIGIVAQSVEHLKDTDFSILTFILYNKLTMQMIQLLLLTNV